jgi:hypothetical protein
MLPSTIRPTPSAAQALTAPVSANARALLQLLMNIGAHASQRLVEQRAPGRLRQRRLVAPDAGKFIPDLLQHRRTNGVPLAHGGDIENAQRSGRCWHRAALAQNHFTGTGITDAGYAAAQDAGWLPG